MRSFPFGRRWLLRERRRCSLVSVVRCLAPSMELRLCTFSVSEYTSCEMRFSKCWNCWHLSVCCRLETCTVVFHALGHHMKNCWLFWRSVGKRCRWVSRGGLKQWLEMAVPVLWFNCVSRGDGQQNAKTTNSFVNSSRGGATRRDCCICNCCIYYSIRMLTEW